MLDLSPGKLFFVVFVVAIPAERFADDGREWRIAVVGFLLDLWVEVTKNSATKSGPFDHRRCHTFSCMSSSFLHAHSNCRPAERRI